MARRSLSAYCLQALAALDPFAPETANYELEQYSTSAHLAAHGVAHVFSEMDVFHFGDALAPLRRAGWDDKKKGPALVAQRARRSLESNIGFYGGTCPAHVFMACVKRWLITGIGVNGGHVASFNSYIISQNLGDRS